MKPRVPGSFAAAITRIKARLGEEAASTAAGRSASLLRKWCDPDHPALPTVRQALSMDDAYVLAALGEPPILNAYGAQLSRYVARRSPTKVDLLRSALAVQAAVGDLSEAIASAVDPAGPEGVALSPAEQVVILGVLDRLKDNIREIEDAIGDEVEAS